MEGNGRFFLFCFAWFKLWTGLSVIAGNGKQSSPEQIKKASASKTEVTKQKKEDVKAKISGRFIWLAVTWGVEEFPRVPGVIDPESGYAMVR